MSGRRGEKRKTILLTELLAGETAEEREAVMRRNARLYGVTMPAAPDE